MKNKIIYISICLLIFAIATTNFVLAEDDDRESEDDYKILENINIPASAPSAPSTPVSVVSVKTIQTSLIDSDSDGIIDSLDKYPGEDDFAFGITDTNLNGIIDNLEYLKTRED